MNAKLKSKLKNCRLLVTDVDGVLTDGKITYSSAGEELKSFHIHDGLGLKLIQNAGLQTAIITGRASPMVERRAKELGIEHLVQGREDKDVALSALCEELGIPLEQTIYLGDDLPDLKAINTAGIGAAPADANSVIKKNADYCCNLRGGKGAVREVCELILEAKGLLSELHTTYGSQA